MIRAFSIPITLLIGALLLAGNVSAQLIADFTSTSPTRGCEGTGLIVTFEDKSTTSSGSITEREWNLGGVTAKNVTKPSRTFSTPGVYRVSLKVKDSNGNNAEKVVDDYIIIYKAPVANFSVNPASACIGSTVTFSNSTTPGDGAITSWVWNLGGTAGTLPVSNGNPVTSTYNTIGKYSITLIVTDQNGCSNTAVKNDAVEIKTKPILSVAADNTTGCSIPHTVNFTNQNLEAGTTYDWTFQGGSPGSFSGPTPPAVSYGSTGSYDVQVVASSANGCTATLSLDDYIKLGTGAQMTASPLSGCLPLTVGVADITGGSFDSLYWETTIGTKTVRFGDNKINSAYKFTTFGNFTIKLVRYFNGCRSETTSAVISIPQNQTVTINADQTAGCSVPFTVNFTASSSVPGMVYNWNFGDGTTGVGTSISHTFTQLGTFGVVANGTAPNGCVTYSDTTKINIKRSQVNVIRDNTGGCVPLTTTLHQNSQSATPIVSWEWTVMDASTPPKIMATSTSATPTVTITDTGTFTVQLIIVNTLGCRDTGIFDNALQAGQKFPIIFDATPKIACVDDAIQFINQSSPLPDVWIWGFDDGGTASTYNADHRFQDSGFFDISLRAIHNGCISGDTIPNMVFINPPVVNSSIVLNCTDPYLVEFSNDSEGFTFAQWDFGDPLNSMDTSTLLKPTYRYPARGTYTASLYAYNEFTGCRDTSYNTFTIAEPIANFSLPPVTNGCVPFELQLTDLSQDGFAYSWSSNGGVFTDPGAVNGIVTYSNAGPYQEIKLTITDVNGCTSEKIDSTIIRANEVTAEFNLLSDPFGCGPLQVNFADASTSLYGTINSWSWSTNGGTSVSTDQNASLVFDQRGNWSVTLTAGDNWGCSKTITKDNLIDVVVPVPAFTCDTLSCAGVPINFTNLSVGTTMTYEWDFDDGNIADSIAPVHSYTTEGYYSPRLRVIDKYGCDSTVTQRYRIKIANPVARFTSDVTEGACPPLLVNFKNQSTNAFSYEWDFGDGKMSTQNDPFNLYDTPGDYTVKLTATSVPGCVDSLSMSRFIRINGPSGTLSLSGVKGCSPFEVTFTATQTKANYYIWDLGNGLLDTTLVGDGDVYKYTYTDEGNYLPALFVVDSSGCLRPASLPVDLKVGTLNLDFVSLDSLQCNKNVPATFISLSTSSSPLTQLEWRFENGTPNSSTALEPTVSFPGPGKYDVTLIAATEFCTDTLSREDYVRISQIPAADFDMVFDPTKNNCVPLAVQFQDKSMSTGGDSLTQWFWDFKNGLTSKAQNPSIVFDGSGQFDVFLEITNSAGCKKDISKSIDINPRPIVTLAKVDEICIGQKAELTAAIEGDLAQHTYTWLPHPDLSCTNCLNTFVKPDATTVYSFEAVNTFGCRDTAEIEVDVRPFPAPVITLSEDTTTCKGNLVQLFVSADLPNVQYNWQNDIPGLSCYNCINPFVKLNTTTTFIVSVTSENLCTSKDTVTVSIIDLSQPFLGTDQIICRGDTISLNIPVGTQPQWLNPERLTCTYCPTTVADPLVNTQYVAQTQLQPGCIIVDTVAIRVIQPSEYSAGDDNFLCINGSRTLNAFAPEGSAIQWSPANTLNNPTLIQPVASPMQDVVYTLTAVLGRCTMKDSAAIQMVTETVISGDEINICKGDSIELTVGGAADWIRWDNPEYLSANEGATVIAAPPVSIEYYLTGQFSTCPEDTAVFKVNVIDNPEFTLAPVWYYFKGQDVPVALTLKSDGPHNFYWEDMPGMSCIHCPDPLITPNDESNVYKVRVENTETGCFTLAETRLEERKECELDLVSAPSMFSPNGDGTNDVWNIYLSTALRQGIGTLTIFDRWGSQVFQSDNVALGWDGKINNQPAPMGTYVYTVDVPCEITGLPMRIMGDLNLVR